jgi:hypothetical protein
MGGERDLVSAVRRGRVVGTGLNLLCKYLLRGERRFRCHNLTEEIINFCAAYINPAIVNNHHKRFKPLNNQLCYLPEES